MPRDPSPTAVDPNLALEAVAARFDMPGTAVGMFPLGAGNINDTFMAVYRAGHVESRCVIQRINAAVFAQPEAVIGNCRVVTDHVHRRLQADERSVERAWQLPRVIACKDGTDFLRDEEGGFWRAMTLIDGAVAHEQVQSPDHAREAGMVLGQFHRLVTDLDPARLSVTIPGFHHTRGYLEAFDRVRGTENGRTLCRDRLVMELCRFVDKRRSLCDVLDQAKARGVVSERIMHGDPKISNIMIDHATGRGTSIIDLDTVGAGMVHWDFGDAVRSICNPAGEDAASTSEVVLDLDLCRSFTAGYLAQTSSILTDDDRSLLYDAVRLIAFELGLRFLQDYLSGDRYFKIRSPRHNVNRALVQFTLCQRIEACERRIRELTERSV